ncbi:MAG TPA: rod shape-determining protein MreC [Aggregatilinea sp.]|uniref:rod shape-determining protein MreC n=1 Tax=Aggregatilinea sp. TaxID=2806333 RepID=UPI002CBEF9E7|nr:rod shape-determining protein MreC [Aggregatilinea sp.]HML24047.1 rod shape-determining protein MreC [Aggregatilinea sp.]
MRAGRVFSFILTMIAMLLLIFLSSRGLLGPLEGVVSVPLSFVQGVVSGITHTISDGLDDLSNFRRLEKRNQDLEEAYAIAQSQLAEYREKALLYDDLASLLDYDRFEPEDREFVTCDVIGLDNTGFVRAIQINCGRRDGVELNDPVVTELGMVGRVTKVSATGAEVLLLTDPNSQVSARAQSTRAEGVVVGQLSGDLLMSYISVDDEVREGDFVVTSGLGQTAPADLILGRVLSVSLAQSELYQEARVRSLVEFDRLEVVQVITNFEPVDLSVFEDQTEQQ